MTDIQPVDVNGEQVTGLSAIALDGGSKVLALANPKNREPRPVLSAVSRVSSKRRSVSFSSLHFYGRRAAGIHPGPA